MQVVSNGVTLNSTGLQFTSTSGASGRSVSIAQGQSGNNGDNLVLQAGQGSATGNKTGGNVLLQAGIGGGTGVGGSVLVKAPDAASTSTFQIQNSSSAIYFNADSVNQRISIGLSTSLTAPSLANAALVVTKAEVQGGVLFGSATNYVASNASNQLRFNGTARNSTNITLVPEFPGATMSATGSAANIGTMTSDFCSNGSPAVNTTVCNTAGDIHNYYTWTTTQASAQDYDIFTRWLVPSNFDASAGTLPTIQFSNDRTSVAAGNAVTLTIYNGNAVCGTATSGAGSAGVWALTTYTTGACTITAGTSVLTFDVHLSATTSSPVRIGEILINYQANF